MFKRIVIGISGGVDSAVSALLLKKKGFDVTGVFMKNWDLTNEFGECSSYHDFEDAKYVCRKLDIPLVEVSFVKEYWNYVFMDFLNDYENGLTPNPDILCNKNIKFDKFFYYSLNVLQCDAIATGHYARTSFGQYLEYYDPDKRSKLLMAKDPLKDQTFFLSQIPNAALCKTMFPLGNLVKSAVKQLAVDNGLKKIAAKRESMGICFVGSRKFQSFITEYIRPKVGQFIDIDTGKVVGGHNGVHHWTIGQRCKISGLKEAYYIAKKSDSNIYVAMSHNHPSLFNDRLLVSTPHWIDSEPIGERFDAKFRFQHGRELVECVVYKMESGNVLVQLSDPLRALTCGQYGVFYSGEECLGSGRIIAVGESVDEHPAKEVSSALN